MTPTELFVLVLYIGHK